MITVTEEMRAAALRELLEELGELNDEELSALHQAEVEAFELVYIPGQVKPTWEEISEGLEQFLTPKEEEQTNES